MAAFAISLGSICSGGNHITVNVVQDGGAQRSFTYMSDDLLTELGDGALQDALAVILRIHCKGMTRVQARNALQAGFTVTI